jgi:hypothetical protein
VGAKSVANDAVDAAEVGVEVDAGANNVEDDMFFASYLDCALGSMSQIGFARGGVFGRDGFRLFSTRRSQLQRHEGK